MRVSIGAHVRLPRARLPEPTPHEPDYAPPAEQRARLRAQRTPAGFRFDVKAYSLLTGHPTKPQSLWKDLREELSQEAREKRTLYPSHLAPDALDEVWRRFAAALTPLHDTGRLGAVLFSTRRDFIRAPSTGPELTTAELFVMRFHGRADDTWKGRTRTAADRFRYLYSEAELEELADGVATVAGEARGANCSPPETGNTHGALAAVSGAGVR